MHSSVIALILLATGLALIYKRNSVKRAPYPPGPAPRFLLGNIYDFPERVAYRVYNEWAKTYGDIMHLEAFGQHVILLNSQEAAQDLLEKRSGIYSSRVVTALIHASEWPSWNMSQTPYGKEWREKRKMAQQYMRPGRIPHYEAIQARRALELLENLAKTPEDFIAHIRTVSTANILSITYNYEIAPVGDPYVDMAEEVVIDLSAATVYPGSEIINSIPILPYLPSWLPFQKRLAKTRETAWALRASTPWVKAKQAWDDGVSTGSIVSELLAKTSEADEKQVNLVRDVAGSLYAGGADTTPASMATFFRAMATNPRAQKAGQAEIDRVTGGQRFPNFSDRPNMPYVDAIVREVFRTGIVLPMSGPHVSTEDDMYNGYFIPKGSVVLANVWAINHDERTYKNPNEFRPERHLTEDGKSMLNGTNNNTDMPLFGHGRRICPGRYLADTSVWITIAYILSAYDISTPEGVDLVDVSVQEYTEGIVHQPKPFRCTIEKRPEGISQSL